MESPEAECEIHVTIKTDTRTFLHETLKWQFHHGISLNMVREITSAPTPMNIAAASVYVYGQLAHDRNQNVFRKHIIMHDSQVLQNCLSAYLLRKNCRHV